MQDPCKADKVASRSNVRRYNFVKAAVLSSLVVFTLVLVAVPSFAARVNFVSPVLGEVDGTDRPEDAGAQDGSLIVRVVRFGDVELIGQPGQPEIEGQVAVVDEAGETVAVDATGTDIELTPGIYTVTVTAGVPTPIPPKIVKIQTNTLHDLVIEYLEPEIVQPANGRLVVRVLPLSETQIISGADEFEFPADADVFVEPGVSGEVTVLNEAGETVAGDVTGSEIELPPGVYVIAVQADAPTPIPLKVVKVEANTLHDLVVEYDDAEPSEPDPNGRLIVSIVVVNGQTGEIVAPEEPLNITIFNELGEPVTSGLADTEISLPPGRYSAGIAQPGNTYVYLAADSLVHLEFTVLL